MRRNIFTLIVALGMLATIVSPVFAQPPAPDDEPSFPSTRTLTPPTLPYAAKPAPGAKQVDQPNPRDYWRNMQRQHLLEAGQTAEADALALTGTDRVLVILVEFAGTDVFTWTAGTSTWDPLGIADPNEYTGTPGDCSVIQEKIEDKLGHSLNPGDEVTFTYEGPLHNMIERPRSLDDRSGDTIWTEDFNPQWFYDFMFGNGVVISYTMQDNTPIYESFIGQSVRDYYSDLSSGRYAITGDVIGWLQLPHSTWWYGADSCPGRRSGANVPHSGAIPGAGNARTLVMDALNAVNAISNTIPGFDWHNYDKNGDGIIDRLWIVHAGYGEEDSTTLLNRDPVTGTNRTEPYPDAFYGEASLWSHSSAVTPPYSVTEDIAAGPYIMMPENGGIGVFAHEYGHNLGADDLYAYDEGETSAGFWTLMADDWTGYPIGFEPPAVDPWHLDNWGWLEPFVITDATKVYTVTLGQASRFANNSAPGDVYRGVKIVLPQGVAPLPVPVWQGDYYWWGGKQDLANAMMTTKEPIDLTGASAVTLTFDLVYDIEEEWDFLWVQVSEDGETWETVTNTNMICTHAPDWIGSLYGFPDDLCGNGIYGFSGYNPDWPDPEAEVIDLTPYAGKSIYLRFWYMTDWATTNSGAFLDSVVVEADGAVVFSDDAESGDANWDYEAPWVRSDGTQQFTHNYYLQWRNVNPNGGYDSALGESRWRFGPANTGLLVWYNNNLYTDNEVFHYVNDYPGFGPKGRMLVVDSHPEPYRDPHWVEAGYPNEGANVSHRSLMRDAPFTLQDTVNFTMTNPYVYSPTVQFSGRPAVSAFHDALGYYPGAEYVRRSPYQGMAWVTKQWDASVTIPSRKFYGVKAPGYNGSTPFRYHCSILTSGSYAGYLGCYWFPSGLGYNGSTGDPAEVDGQYGWHVQLLEESPDHTWATVRIWNSMYYMDADFVAAPATVHKGDVVTYTYTINQNIGSGMSPAVVAIPLDTTRVEYVPGSAFGGAIPVPGGMTADELTALYREGGLRALKQLAVSQASEAGMIVWAGDLAHLQSAPSFGFQVRVKPLLGTIDLVANGSYEGQVFQTTPANTVTVVPAYQAYLPVVLKNH